MLVRVKPLRLRVFGAFFPARVEGGYTDVFYEVVSYIGLRPYRGYVSKIKPLFSRFRLAGLDVGYGVYTYYFELPPGVEPVELTGDLALLARIAEGLQ